jgi:hypothetical protein
MNSVTALVTSRTTEGALFGLGEVGALLTMNSVTALVMPHNIEGKQVGLVRARRHAYCTMVYRTTSWQLHTKVV